MLLSTHIVGDSEATCESIAIQEAGRLLYQGTVDALCNMAEGSVYTAEVPQAELARLRAAYTVTSTLAKGNRCSVRFLSPDSVPSIGLPVEPNAEDAYILCLGNAAKGGAST